MNSKSENYKAQKSEKIERNDEFKLTSSAIKSSNGPTEYFESTFKKISENKKDSKLLKVSGDQLTSDKNQAWSFRKLGNTNNFRGNSEIAWDVYVHINDFTTNLGTNINLIKHNNPPFNTLTGNRRFFGWGGPCAEEFSKPV